jgi:LacI family transcriptional regulator
MWNTGIAAYGADILVGACKYAKQSSGILILRPDPFDTASVPINGLTAYDGVLARIHSKAAERALAALPIPCVSVFHGVPCHLLPRVGVDEVALGRLAARHLLDRGHSCFAYLRAPGHAYSSDREAGFRKALQSEGHDLGYVWPVRKAGAKSEGRPWQSLYLNTEATGSWLAGLPRPAALLAANDVFAHFASAAALLAHVRVPEDLAILGADNDASICESAHVSLSSIPTPAQKIGWTAVKIIDDVLSGKPPPNSPVLIPPCEVVTRRSTDLVAIADAGMARALRRIADRSAERVSVRDLAREAGLSRRALEYRFHESLGRSPMAEVRRVRMERAKHLLLATSMPVYQVATSAGFSTQEHFCSQFKRETGMTPTQFRHRHAVGTANPVSMETTS